MIEYTVTVDEKGTIRWHLNDELHREDGPAIEKVDGYKAWYKNDELHREDGPAIEYANGSKEWYIHGERLTEEQFNERTKFKSIIIDGKEIKLSIESFNELKKQLT